MWFRCVFSPWAWLLFCSIVFVHMPAQAEEPGKPGGPCLADDTCESGAECYKRPDGATICLIPADNLGGNTNTPGTNSNQVLEQCPPQHRYLSCPPGGGTCQLRCVYPKGFGCSVTSPSGLWNWLLLFFLGWLFVRALRSHKWRATHP